MTFQTLKYVKYIFILLKTFLLLQTEYMKRTVRLPAFFTCPSVLVPVTSREGLKLDAVLLCNLYSLLIVRVRPLCLICLSTVHGFDPAHRLRNL